MLAELKELRADAKRYCTAHDAVRVEGRVTKVLGTELWIRGLAVQLGDVVELEVAHSLHAEVIALGPHHAVALPLGEVRDVRMGTKARLSKRALSVPCGRQVLGRVLGPLGEPLDGKGALDEERYQSNARAPHPLTRGRITRAFPTGVKVIDLFATMGEGQRMGVFAGSGVGKSTLLGMIARGVEADAVVVGLVGERGREVREFLEDELGAEALAKSCVVVATADQPAVLRARAAETATSIAEGLAAQGLRVVLLFDSLTRYAQALREVGVAAGEPPANKGYPPSVFTKLAALLERTGPQEHGTITAIYTVLVDGDDTVADPIGDHVRSVVDGHLILSRKLAEEGHYPTVEPLASCSRLATKFLTAEQQALIVRARKLLSVWKRASMLVEVGAYVPGSSIEVDEAMARREGIERLLQQGQHEPTPYHAAWSELEDVC